MRPWGKPASCDLIKPAMPVLAFVEAFERVGSSRGDFISCPWEFDRLRRKTGKLFRAFRAAFGPDDSEGRIAGVTQGVKHRLGRCHITLHQK
jgi:hypothetical protein